MTKLSYSQQIYPKKLLIDGDTVVVLKPNQIKSINLAYSYMDYLKSENLVLTQTLNKFTLLNNEKDSLLNVKKSIQFDLINETKRLTKENIDLNINLQQTKKRRKYWFISGLLVGSLTIAIIK